MTQNRSFHFFQAPRKLVDSGCNSSAEQVAMSELEKLLVANPRYTECNWLIRPRQMGKQANYPVVRLANGIQPRKVVLEHLNEH